MRPYYSGRLNAYRWYDADVHLLSFNPGFDGERCKVKIVDQADKDKNKIIKQLTTISIMAEYTLLALLYQVSGRYFKNERLVLKDHVWSEYCNSDLIIGGLNDSFTTLYGPFPFITNCYNIYLGKLLGKKVVLYGCSIGPFKNGWYELLGRSILDQVDLITLREDISYDYLRRIGVKNKSLYVTADLAFALDNTGQDRIKEIMVHEKIPIQKKPLVGVSLSKVIARWAFMNGVDTKDKYENYTLIMSRVIDHIIEKWGATVIFIPHSIGMSELNDDRIAHRDIYEKLNNKKDAILIDAEYTPGELRGLIGECNFFIGARTHSIISAAMVHTPFIALEYESFKTMGIIGNMLECKDYVYNVKFLDGDSLLALIEKTWANKEGIKQHLELRAPQLVERVLQNVNLIKVLINK
jgi:polysaccharide pyruvyl transferase WcaK-like protein